LGVVGLCCVRYMRRERPDQAKVSHKVEPKVDLVIVDSVVGARAPPQVAVGVPPREPSPSNQPVQAPNNPKGDAPGLYEIVKDYTAIGPDYRLGQVTAELTIGTVVEVVEVVWNQVEERVRGRVAYPPGWISLYSTAPGDFRRWARQVAEEVDASLSPTRTPASQPTSPSAVIWTPQVDRTASPPETPSPSRTPSPRRPAAPREASPTGLTWAPLVANASGKVTRLRTPGGQSPGVVPPQVGGSSRGRSRTTSPGAQVSPLPGDYHAGTRVTSLVDFVGKGGQITKGEVGVVVGPCRGFDGEGAEWRVNCKFPRHPNINLKVSQLERTNAV